MTSAKKNKSFHPGYAIALAWPSTLCKQPGSWYDRPALWLGINKNYYYTAGHAAVVLVDAINLKCHYFDFGRYHAPFQYGRVRSSETDHDLAIHTDPIISFDTNKILNLHTILNELQNNTSCHGDGALYASYSRVNFLKAYAKAIELQQASPLPYGPFIRSGTNCSRFVNTVIRAGKPEISDWIRLRFFVPITPTPMNNVKALKHPILLPATKTNYIRKEILLHDLNTTMPSPYRHATVPINAQWVSGEGAGSWFHLKENNNDYMISRYSPEGKLECQGIFTIAGSTKQFNYYKPFVIEHLSHCKLVTLSQDGIKIQLKLKEVHPHHEPDLSNEYHETFMQGPGSHIHKKVSVY